MSPKQCSLTASRPFWRQGVRWLKKTKFLSVALPSFVACAALLLLAGCASPATSSGMVPANVSIKHKHDSTVCVSVAGGEQTNPWGASKVSGEAFDQALREAITKSGIFKAVAPEASADYRLVAVVTFLKIPRGLQERTLNGDLPTDLTVEWNLTRKSDKKVVWRETITSQHVAKLGDAIMVIKRQRLADEGAARKNIIDGIQSLSRLNLAVGNN